MEKVVLYGAGEICRNTIPLILQKYHVSAIIDKRGCGAMYDIPIISLDEYIAQHNGKKIILTLNHINSEEVTELLNKNGITNYVSYRDEGVVPVDNRIRLISYSQFEQDEDVILYNALEDYDDIFYIDVGSNDPIINSVTKLFYDTKNAHGINIEPQQDLMGYTLSERPRDINLCCAVSDDEGIYDMYIQGDMTTFLQKNIASEYYQGKTSVKTRSLRSICDEYVPASQTIHFLKIDVEGYERKVLLSADFEKYRPLIIVLESTLPNTDIPCYSEWEDILIKNHYHYVYERGVNRYYVSDEHKELDGKFCPIIEILKKYRVVTLNDNYKMIL